MALEAGDAAEGTGLAGEIAEKSKELVKRFDVNKGAEGINALAAAIVDYITANAEVEVSGVTSGASSASGTIS